MPVSFARLRIAGFKSFPEPATLEILPGLTGIVGPNGCGKSNVVEALRWAMGEGSAKSLRGGEMDDVIFAGTAHRPSRNIAEVTIGLEQTQGLAPPPFQEAPELEVVRRIERGSGSFFRVNGREARARDVQTLFADLATGARASAMVSQGRVSALVSARPEERRAILEEAAGITGLHARRHEAELKLRAAEANLARADDLQLQLATQLDALRKQARQAARLRDIADLVRSAEAELLAVQNAIAGRARGAALHALHEAGEVAAAATLAATRASEAAAGAAVALPALREAEADARTALERTRLGAEQVAADAARAAAALHAATQRRQQTARDLTHAEQAGRDSQAALARLADEAARLEAEAAGAPERLMSAEAAAQAAADALRVAEAQAEQAVGQSAELAARAQAAGAAFQAAEQRARRVAAQAAALDADRGRAAAQAVPQARLAETAAAAQAAGQAAATARAELEAANSARAAAQQALARARDQAATADGARTRLAAAAQGLAEAIGARTGERFARMVDQVSVPPGLEPALGAAMGEALDAAANPAAPRHWRELPPCGDVAVLPEGAQPLAELVEAPAALARALSQIGLLAPGGDGAALQPGLGPGQVLVSRDGAVWRGDGFVVRAGAPSAAAVRLQQRNRLAGLRAELATAEAAAAAARAVRAGAEASERETVQAEQRARAAARDADQHSARTRETAMGLERSAAAAAAQLGALDQASERMQAELAEADAALYAARRQRDALPDPATLRATMEQARAALAAARTAEQTARAARDALARATAQRSHRLGVLAREMEDWRARADDARGRLTDLAARAGQTEAEHGALLAAPTALQERHAQAVATMRAGEAALRHAAETLQQAERHAAGCDRAGRDAGAALAVAREARLRAEAAAAAADHAWGTVAERIVERLGASPALPDPPAAIDPDTEDRLRRRLERLQRERDAFGPVNLRAEIEAAEIGTQAETIEREAAELSTAIAKLRGSIGHINREGRERLGQVFADIDRHFRALFETMFGGGRAHLALVGSDDPLLAGLEIYAQPPGKKLATLSLLSGGEQALTALSLIFAVFRCNPAPVCVLDEVDAPLDDANVERFCGLLEAMVRETGTRFLVVTHHQLTMARMDRLYGVTMQERGVSRLLSVDLSRAVAMVEPERMAAE